MGKEGAKATLTVWEDFRCPACKSFEQTYRTTLNELTEAGQLKVEYHLVTLIDGGLGGSGSLRAANAAACAQDAGKFTPYHDMLFENQPMESDDAFSDDARLIDLAGKVDGLDTPSSAPASRTARTTAGWSSPTRPSRRAASAAPRRCCSKGRTSTRTDP